MMSIISIIFLVLIKRLKENLPYSLLKSCMIEVFKKVDSHCIGKKNY